METNVEQAKAMLEDLCILLSFDCDICNHTLWSYCLLHGKVEVREIVDSDMALGWSGLS